MEIKLEDKPKYNMRKDTTMNKNIKKTSVAFIFTALLMLTVSSAQATESIWFSGQEQYAPAANYLNDGSCYSAAHNSENIFLATAGSMKKEAKAGTCSLTDISSHNIWLQTNNP
jgi:hypothetical protein